MLGPAMARLAPVVILVGYLLRPFVSSYADASEVAGAAAGGAARWVASSVLIAIGFGLLVLAVTWMASTSSSRTAHVAPPAMTLGAVLLALQLGALAAATASASEAGADPVAVFDEVRSWEGPLIASVLVAVVLAWGCLAHALATSGHLGPGRSRVVTVALGLAVVGLLVPSSLGEYLTGIALIVACWVATSCLSRPTPAGT